MWSIIYLSYFKIGVAMPRLKDFIEAKVESSVDPIDLTAHEIAASVDTVESVSRISSRVNENWEKFDSYEQKREAGSLRYGQLAIEYYVALPHVSTEEQKCLVHVKDILEKLNPDEARKNPTSVANNYSDLISSVNQWLNTQPNASADKEKVLEFSRTLYTLLYITQHALEELNNVQFSWRTKGAFAIKQLVNSCIGKTGIAGRLTELSALLKAIEDKIALIAQQASISERKSTDNPNTPKVHGMPLTDSAVTRKSETAVSDDATRLSKLSSEIDGLEEKLRAAQAMEQLVTDNNKKEKLYFIDLIKGPDGKREQLSAFMAQIDEKNTAKQELLKQISAFDDPTTYQKASSAVLSTASWAFAKPTSLLRSIIPVPEIKFLQQVQDTVTNSVNYIFATADSNAKSTLLGLAQAESARLTIELDGLNTKKNQLQQQVFRDKPIQPEPVSLSRENDQDSSGLQDDGLSNSASKSSVETETPLVRASPTTHSVAPSFEGTKASLSERSTLTAPTVSDVPRQEAIQQISSLVTTLLDECKEVKQSAQVKHDAINKSSRIGASLLARFLVAANLVDDFTKETSKEDPEKKKFIDKVKIKFKDTLNETKILIQCKTKLKRIDEILMELNPSLKTAKQKVKSTGTQPEKTVDHDALKNELQNLKADISVDEATVRHGASSSKK